MSSDLQSLIFVRWMLYRKLRYIIVVTLVIDWNVSYWRLVHDLLFNISYFHDPNISLNIGPNRRHYIDPFCNWFRAVYNRCSFANVSSNTSLHFAIVRAFLRPGKPPHSKSYCRWAWQNRIWGTLSRGSCFKETKHVCFYSVLLFLHMYSSSSKLFANVNYVPHK